MALACKVEDGVVRVRVVVEDFTHISLSDFAALPSDAGAWLVPLCADHPTPVMWGHLLCTKRSCGAPGAAAAPGSRRERPGPAARETPLEPPGAPSSSERVAWMSLSSSQVQAGRTAVARSGGLSRGLGICAGLSFASLDFLRSG